MTESNRFWDVGRFWQTLDFFDAIPIVSELKKMFSVPDTPQPFQLQGDILFDFAQNTFEQVQLWGSLDDVVMGGVSSSAFRPQADHALFTGEVSTGNSGGFVSVRTRNFDPPIDLSDYTGIALQIKGDGQRYKFFLRDKDGWDALAYGYSFDTRADEWITVEIPFSELIAVFRAKTQADAPAFEPSSLRSLQLMLSKFEYDRALNPHFKTGPFCLRVRGISAYR